MDDRIKEGYIRVGGNDWQESHAGRSDLVKWGVQITPIGHVSWDIRFELAKAFAHTAMHLTVATGEDSAGREIRRPFTPEEATDHAIAMAEMIFAKGLEKDWVYKHDKDAVEAIVNAEAVSDYSGVVPGRR